MSDWLGKCFEWRNCSLSKPGVCFYCDTSESKLSDFAFCPGLEPSSVGLHEKVDALSTLIAETVANTRTYAEVATSATSNSAELKKLTENVQKQIDTTKKESLKCNAILHGLPESDNDKTTNTVLEITDELKLHESQVLSIARVGRLSDDKQRNRPVKIGFKSELVKFEFLKRGRY
jgi:hypothetical protein